MPDVALHTARRVAPRIELHDDFVRVTFAHGGHADYHWLWLRHQCPHEVHPTTRERTIGPAQVAPSVRPVHAVIDADSLAITWSDAPERAPSRYPLTWLDDHAYARDRALPRRAASLAEVEVALDPSGALPSDWVERLARDGVIIGRGGPADPEATERRIEEIAARGYGIVSTHFGRIEDLRTDNTTNQNTDQLGYTDAPIDLHTDQPFLASPPRYQLLHTMRAADEGGETLIADADAAAHALAASDAEAYALLTTTPLRFHRKQRAFERVQVSPLLVRGGDGRHTVRSSYFTLAPFDVPFDRMEALYRALRRFEALVHSPAHLLRLLLRPGDLVIYDNHRMLHGRAGFRGRRWVRGVYFDPA